MQSVHAGTCLLRVGPCRLGSILGTISDPFWGPSSLLYSLVGARGAETGPQKSYLKMTSKNNQKLTKMGPKKDSFFDLLASFFHVWRRLG